MHAVQGGGAGAQALRLFGFYESGPVFFSPVARFERRAVLETHARGGAGHFRPVHVLGWRDSLGTGERILQPLLPRCHETCAGRPGNDRCEPLLRVQQEEGVQAQRGRRRGHLQPVLPPAAAADSRIRFEGLCVGSHLSAFQSSACTGRIAENEIFHRGAYLSVPVEVGKANIEIKELKYLK